MQPLQSFSDFEYICLCDRKLPEKEQTVWTLTSLTIEQEAFLDDNVQINGQMQYGTISLHVLNMGLKKVKNFGKVIFSRDKDGFEYPGKMTPWKSDILRKIPIAQRRELSAKIRALADIEEDELKNS
jgi:hypothetical protein